ncbi:MAG: VOC family protein [Mizugakiibacter sp.]|uniref:VOC family protein n=1 Tax=Mizugakiibacter sp. TaxID=1972610 RepID=UPI0031C0639D|nr:VOC family protein [Xanthomonadaceae bacterium]
MHHSRLAGFVIDCRTDDFEAAARFWSGALGLAVKPPSDSELRYREFENAPDGLELLLQQVEHDSRAHLDIATDDLEAEVERLEALGAKRIEFVKRWWVMQAPTGHRFCVVLRPREQLEGNANRWESA